MLIKEFTLSVDYIKLKGKKREALPMEPDQTILVWYDMGFIRNFFMKYAGYVESHYCIDGELLRILKDKCIELKKFIDANPDDWQRRLTKNRFFALKEAGKKDMELWEEYRFYHGEYPYNYHPNTTSPWFYKHGDFVLEIEHCIDDLEHMEFYLSKYCYCDTNYSNPFSAIDIYFECIYLTGKNQFGPFKRQYFKDMFPCDDY